MATMTVNDLSHVGNATSTIVQHLSKNPATVDSLINEFKKDTNPKTAAEIDRNRAIIESTISSLGGDKVFQDALASTLNKISEARSKVKEVTLAWLLWFVLLGVLYLLRQSKFLRTAGWQLFSVGVVFLGAHFAAPVMVHDAINNSDMPGFQKDLLPEVLKSLTKPMMVLSIIGLFGGVVLLVSDQLVRNRLRSRTTQISPSVVA